MIKSKSSLELLPADIKSALIEKILTGVDTLDDMTQWLSEVHEQKYSKSAIHRFAQAVKLTHSGLIALGVPPKILAAHAAHFEKLGVYLVQRELLNRRIDALQKSIFDGLGDCYNG